MGPVTGKTTWEFSMLKLAVATSALLAVMATSAQAVPVFFKTGLSGASEAPANASSATGWANVFFDPDVHTMRVIVSFQGLSSPNTASHIHCCTATPFDITQTAPVATPTPTFPGFPSGTSGFYDQIFDMTLASSYRAGFITGHGGTVTQAEADLYNGLLAGTAYLNVHSTNFPGGEIRGFLQVPEPLSLSLFGAGLAGVAALRRRKPRI